MSQILEDNFNSFIGATYGCEPIELPGEQLRGLRFAFFGGAMIVNSCIVEKQCESDVELFNLQTEFNDALEEFQKELEVYIDAEVADIIENNEPLLIINTPDELETILSWNLSKNHTNRYGVIQGIYSRTYEFMSESKEEVLEWLVKNYKKNN